MNKKGFLLVLIFVGIFAFVLVASAQQKVVGISNLWLGNDWNARCNQTIIDYFEKKGYKVTRALVADQPFTINGDGDQTRDYTYVGDVVQAVLQAAALPTTDGLPILNIGTGVETSVNALVTHLQALAGRSLAFHHGPQPSPGSSAGAPWTPPAPSASSAGSPRWTCGPAWRRTLAWFRQRVGAAREE